MDSFLDKIKSAKKIAIFSIIYYNGCEFFTGIFFLGPAAFVGGASFLV